MTNPVRHSKATKENPAIEDVSGSGMDNIDFLEWSVNTMNASGNENRIFLCLVGSRDIPSVRLRRAQSILRWDMRPSLWSEAYILDPASVEFIGVPLHARQVEFRRPEVNGLCRQPLALFADTALDANFAVLSCTVNDDEFGVFRARIEDPNQDRLRYDFWQSLAVWQSYLWSFGSRPNPLSEGWPIPSSSFVEYCFEGIGTDITPAASERNSAPEHLWNAAKWWYDALNAQNRPITGYYILRDKGCATLSTDDPPQIPLTTNTQTSRSTVRTEERRTEGEMQR